MTTHGLELHRRRNRRAMTLQRELRRSREDRVLGGVAGGLADFLDIDVSLVRLAFVLTTLWGGFGLIVYAVLWAVLPEGDRAEDILARRVERGEISGAEYREMLADVTRGGDGRSR